MFARAMSQSQTKEFNVDFPPNWFVLISRSLNSNNTSLHVFIDVNVAMLNLKITVRGVYYF